MRGGIEIALLFLSSLRLEKVDEAVCGSPKTRGHMPGRLTIPARGPRVAFQTCGRERKPLFLFVAMWVL